MATKSKVTVPPIVKVGAKKADETQPTTKRSEITHKSDKDATNLYQVLSKTEETIQELTRMFAECEDSTHIGVGGMPKLTPKQQAIQKELDEARRRYDMIFQTISNG